MQETFYDFGGNFHIFLKTTKLWYERISRSQYSENKFPSEINVKKIPIIRDVLKLTMQGEEIFTNVSSAFPKHFIRSSLRLVDIQTSYRDSQKDRS